MLTRRFLVAACALAACSGEPRPPLDPIDGTPTPQRLLWFLSDLETGGMPAADEKLVYYPLWNFDLIAVDKATGKIQWRTALNPGPWLPPLGVTLTPDCVLASAGDLLCVDPKDGSVRWRFVSPVDGHAGYYIPAEANGVVYTGSRRGKVFAVDAKDGALRWIAELAESATTDVYAPVVRGGSVYVAFTTFSRRPARDTGYVAALDAATGATRWVRKLPIVDGFNSSTLEVVLSGGVAIAASEDGLVHAMDTADGSIRWTVPRARRDASDPTPDPTVDRRPMAESGGVVFIGSTVGTIAAHSAGNGTLLWSRNARAGSPFMLRTDGTHLFSTYHGGQLGAMSNATGAITLPFERPRLPTGVEMIFYAPAFDTTAIYFGGFKGAYAYRR